ncbi:hypothetical protein [Ruegeria conchae]|uniref:Uncharacterized protein n=1 Tax=Ruegeria conchae TaxID=981384 RepID=A0A497Z0N7_9RHOB|nr:hypothetical protein [Ruegeria conchae]RLJ98865.1 hypothetical protein CLV75_3986 [Ruegeria conchae]
MKTSILSPIKASAVAIALLGSTAVVVTVAMPDVAIAKEGKGNGGGNGGGQGGGKGGGNGNSGNNGGADKGDRDSASNNKKGSDGNRKVGKSGGSIFGGSKSKSSRSTSENRGRFSLKDLFNGGGKAKGAANSRTRTTTSSGKQLSKTNKQTTENLIVDEPVRPAVRPTGNRVAALLGAHPSELGALNAANASATALANASPNSRVGRIATYRDTVLAGDLLREDLAEQLEELTGLEPPERTVAEIEEDLEVALDDVQTNQELVDELEQALEDAGGTDPVIEEQLDQAQMDLEGSIEEARDLNEERQAALEYEEATEEVRELVELVEEQELAEREALEAAANKPVTDAVEEEVKSLLGL